MSLSSQLGEAWINASTSPMGGRFANLACETCSSLAPKRDMMEIPAGFAGSEGEVVDAKSTVGWRLLTSSDSCGDPGKEKIV